MGKQYPQIRKSCQFEYLRPVNRQHFIKNGPFLALVVFCTLAGCKKDQQSQAPKLVDMSIEGQTAKKAMDAAFTFRFLIGDDVDITKVQTHFKLNAGNKALLNNTEVTDGSVIDFSEARTLTVVAGERSANYTIDVQKEWSYFGLTGTVTASKSLNKDYNFYFDQFDGSALQAINCGPTVTTMAIKWVDKSYTGTPAQARTDVPANNDWWYTNNITKYLGDHGVSNSTVMITDFDSLVKTNIDKGRLIILCLDMYLFVNYNSTDYQHTEKFYQTLAKDWGHFLLVKGYKVTTTGLYLEIYDPYSQNRLYADEFSLQVFGQQQSKGKDRYYSSSTIVQSCMKWWPYVILVAPQGQTATTAVTGGRLVHPSQIPAARGR